MTWPVRSLVLYIGLPILSVGALALYLWQKKEEDEWSEMVRGLTLVERDVRIPQQAVATLVGRGGSRIREIQETTSTKIHFRDGENHLDYATCRITGKGENVNSAVLLVMDTVNEPSNLKTFEMWVPSTSCGRIIGRCGDTIRSLVKTSGAKIYVDKKLESASQKKLITIRGTEEQIKTAINLVEEKVNEDEVARNKLHLTLSTGSPRGLGRKSNGSVTVQTYEYERLIATTGETMHQVYVSSIISPVHFFVQVITPQAADLDQLVEEMTEYYRSEEHREPLDIDKIVPGLIVACLMSDTKWYRVQIRSIDSPAEPTEETKIDVFYVDYGESEYILLKDLCHLSDAFLRLRFQAIEVQMVGIAPIVGEEWTEQEINAFIDSSYGGQWRVLVAEVVGYKRRPDGTTKDLIPCVKLYDPDGPPGVDLGQQLVDQNLAKRVPIEDLSPNFVINGKGDSGEDW